MKCLILNSYAGSLTIAATQLGLDIIGSYEDVGYGIAAQKLNFPHLTYVDKLPWPARDLSGVLVIAHPPCAPFSVQNSVKNARGTATDGFECHRRVMTYALGQGCRGLAIESVPGVMRVQGEYETQAVQHGYKIFFLHVNSISFGVPQWRPRVWIIFLKEAARLALRFEPTYKPLKDVLRTEGLALEGMDETPKVIRRLREAGLTNDQLKALFNNQHGTGSLLQLGSRFLQLEEVGINFKHVREAWKLGGLFASKMPRLLDEAGWAPTVLRDSAWFVRGRPLFLEEYHGIMGFPVDYRWPDNFADPRVYLSKGVCPPVATWVLRQMMHTWEDEVDLLVEDRQGIDLCPKKTEVTAILTGHALASTPHPRNGRPATTVRRVASTEAEQQGWLERL